MAKIHNPQNQEGINLVNEEIFNEQVASLNNAITKEIADREAAITAEAAAREAAITVEATARANADAKETTAREAAITAEAAARQKAITAETAAREAAITAENTRATKAEEALLTKITEETGRAEGVENSIKATIGEVPSDKTIAQMIEDEVISRANGDKTLNDLVENISGQIDIVENTLNNAIDEVKTLVNTNTQNLNALSAEIDEETTNRENAVTSLLGSIGAEITRAENAEQNIADNTHLYNGKFGNWDIPSDRRDKATCNYFRLVPTKTGYIKSLKLRCRPDGAVKPQADKTFIQIAREDGTDIDNGRSINACEHVLNAESLYEFDKECLLEKGSMYRFKFIGEESGSIIEACITTTKTAANGATAEELFGGNIVGSIGAVGCQAIFEIVLLNKVQADSEKVALIDNLPTYADVNSAILIALNDYPTTESIDTKLENYQLKSEVEESSDRYKFIPGDNSSAINVNFADIETNGNFSGNQSVNKTIVLNLNKDNSKVITANATFNTKQLNPVINDGTVSIEVTIESTDSSGYIILNTICDSTAYDNAQYVCHVVPVSITA